MPNLTNLKLTKLFDALAFVFLVANVVVVPLFFDSSVSNFYVIPKQYVFIGLVLFNLFFFAAKVVLTKKMEYRKSSLDVFLLVFLGVVLISSLLSTNLNDSFLGRGEFFSLNFVFLAFSVLFYFAVVNVVNSPERWRIMVDAILSVSALTSLFFILKVLFKVNLPILGSVINVIDGQNSLFGLWMVSAFVISAGSLVKRNLSVVRSVFYFLIMVLAAIPLLVMGFKFLWWVLLAGLILLLLLGASFIHEARVGWLSVLFAVLITVSVFIIFGSPKSLQSVLPIEVSLDINPSWTITKNTIFSGAKNFLIGSGPGTFAYDFSKFRTNDFNYDQVAWALRFNQPFNIIFAVLAEGGVLLLLSFVFILLFVLGHVLSTWFKARGAGQGIAMSLNVNKANIRIDIFLLVVAWLMLWIGMALTYLTVPFWVLWWLLLGLIISGLQMLGHDVIKQKSWTMEDTPQYNLAFSFSVIVVMAVVVLLGVLGLRFYWAEKVYAAALRTPDVDVAETKLRKSVELREGADLYHVALAKVYLVKAGQASQGQSPNMQAVADLLAKAVNEAKRSTDLSGNSVGLWENLATMYENTSMLVPEAGEWAIKSLNRAVELEPTNAVLYWRLGNNYSLASNLSKAIENYKKAIDLKKDYLGAYVSLSSAYETNKEIDKAIDTYKNLVPIGISNPEVLFNYGRLLYNRNSGDDRDNAEKFWLEAVRIQPSYSNALYSLGLLYESEGNKSKALQYYYKVKDLNPENKDINSKIKSLVSGS